MDLHRLRSALAAAALVTIALAGAPDAQAATVETVARGLDNPRGVALGPDGAVYVANSGRGGRTCRGKGENSQCFGLTGRVVRVAGGNVQTIAKGFFSVGGRDGEFAGGVDGVSVAPDGTVFGVTGSATPKDVKSLPKPARRQAGRLFELGGGDFEAVARIDQVEWKQNIDGVKGDRNSNPYAVLALADRQIVADAGANAILEVRNGQVEVLAVMPKNGKAQSVPTSLAVGPNGDILVGELALGAGKGKARVWRIPAAGGPPVVQATGFTAITGVAIGPDGSLFVTEFAQNLEKGNLAGAVVRLAPDGTRTRLGGKKLLAPTGAAVDSTGAVYVSNFSVLPAKTPKKSDFGGAGGTLVKITP